MNEGLLNCRQYLCVLGVYIIILTEHNEIIYSCYLTNFCDW